MSIYSQLGLNFDTNRFGAAQTLSSGAANTISLINSNTPALKDWQITDLETGSISRTNYFQNPTTSNITAITANTVSIAMNALSCGNTNPNLITVFNSCQSLIIVLNQFQSHTDNISGVSTVSDPNYPSYETASSVGQMNMMNLPKAGETQSNTSAILGSFTSLFIQDDLVANNNQLGVYSTQLRNSITVTTDPVTGLPIYTSNLSAGQVTAINNYLNSTSTILSDRYTNDWTFFRNSVQYMKNQAFLQQFSNMGGTNTYLINNVIGTNSLKSKIQAG